MNVKSIRRLLALLAAVIVLVPMTVAYAVDDGFSSTYTYNYDYWDEIRESPDAYRVDEKIYFSQMGLAKDVKKPASLFVKDQDLYVVDSGAADNDYSQILKMTKIGTKFELRDVIDQVKATKEDYELAKNRYENAVALNDTASQTRTQATEAMDAPLNAITAVSAEKISADNALAQAKKIQAALEDRAYITQATKDAAAQAVSAAEAAAEASARAFEEVTRAATGENAKKMIRTASLIGKLSETIVDKVGPMTSELVAMDVGLENANKAVEAAAQALNALNDLPAEVDGADTVTAALDASAAAAGNLSAASAALKEALSADIAAERERLSPPKQEEAEEGDETESTAEEAAETSAEAAEAEAQKAELAAVNRFATAQEDALGKLDKAASAPAATRTEFDAIAAKVATLRETTSQMKDSPTVLRDAANECYIMECKVHLSTQWTLEDGAAEATSRMKTATDMAVDNEGNIYVADKANNRIIKMTPDRELIMEFTKPSDSNFDQKQSFYPDKLVVDSTGRVFALASNVNKGLIKFEADGTFTGFIGANQVTYNMWDYIWKTYFMTKEQRSQQVAFVPTEYKNIYIDHQGFIYATNISFSEYDLLWDGAKPIRRLNAVGTDILIKNDRRPPIGDLDWVEQSTDHGPSKFYDITVMDNDMYVAIDQTRGRVFGYDPQGIMLWAFGTSGVPAEGAFNRAISIEHIGTDLIVLDELDSSVTVFTPTEYGKLIYEASDQYLKGDYDGSAETWKKVQEFNANYNLAFIGIGRSKMRAEEYQDAMELFKMAHDRDNYGRAFRYYRKIWVENNIWWVVLIIGVLVVFSIVRKTIRKVKWEVAAYEHNKVAK